MENALEIIDTQLRTQQIIDLARGRQAQPHLLHEFLQTLSGEQLKTAIRLIQKTLEQS
jgi:pseudouridine-5'-phosphate glycosidase